MRRGIDRFSWYIYRITTPALRDLLMASGKNVARVEEALMSLLSVDVARYSPVRFRLVIFQLFYYMKALNLLTARLFGRRAARA